MIDLDDFLPLISPKAPGCPVPAARIAILQAAAAICEKSRLWKHTETIPVLTLADIDLTPPEGSIVLDYDAVLFNDIPLEAKTTQWMDQCMRGWRRGDISGYPRFYTQTNVGTLRIAPMENGLLTICVTLKPDQQMAEQLPDFLFQQYGELLAWGALGRLLTTPDQPFTNEAMGVAYLADFESRLSSLAYKSTTGQQRSRPRVKSTFM